MTPSQLLTRIEQLGIVDAKYIKKIRKQIDDPNKVVKPKAVVGYLLKKSQIDQAQAVALLAPPPEDELEVVQPVENDYDTGTLIAEEPEILEPAATIMDDGQFYEEDVEVVDVQPVEEPEVIEPVEIQTAPSLDPLDDPTDGLAGGGLNAPGYSSGAYATQSGPQETVAGFVGKKDSSDQFKTKWLYIGFGLLAFILLGTALFYMLLANKSPDKMLEACNDAFNRQSWADAVKKMDNFLEAYPSHPEAPTVRAKRVNAILRGIYTSKRYREIFPQADALLSELAEEKDTKIEVIRDDIGVILPDSLANLAGGSAESMVSNGDNVDVAAMEKEYDALMGFQKVVNNPIYVTNSARRKTSIANDLLKANNSLQTIRGLITKEKEYLAALKDIAAFREASDTVQAFDTFRQLTRRHGDIAVRKPIRDLMKTVSQKESELVKPVELDLKPLPANRPSPIENTIVLARTDGKSARSLQGEVVPVLVEGSVYGFDAGTGKIAWRQFVGFETDVPPVKLDAERTLLADLQHNDLICVNTATGELDWRVELGSRFATPVVKAEMIVVSTQDGHLIQIGGATGEFLNACKLPQRTNSPALIGERDPYIYQAGSDHSSIYAISSQSFRCESVYSLEHRPGSIVVPPVQWMGYILVLQNGGNYCDLNIFKAEDKGRTLTLVQRIQRVVDSKVSKPMVKAGRSMLVIGDKGHIQLLDIDATQEDSPISSMGQVLFSDPGDIKPFLSAEGSQMWVAANGIVRARIRRNQGTIQREVAAEARHEFLSAAYKLDDFVMHIRRRVGSGMISASLVDSQSLEEVWRTDFAGELAGQLIEQEGVVMAVSNQGDLFKIDPSAIESQLANDPIRGSTVVQDLQFSNLLRLEDDSLIVTGPMDRKDLLFVKGGVSKLVALSPPANKPATAPLVINGGVLVPSATGHVARVNPESGALRGTPFQRPVAPTANINWLPPVSVSEGLVAIASGRTPGETSTLYLLSTVDDRKIQKLGSIDVANPFKGRIATDGESVFAILDNNGFDTLAVFSTAAPIKQSAAVELEGDCVQGPWLTEAGILVKLNNDQLYCYGTDMQKRWSIAVPNERFASAPAVAGTNLRLAYQGGEISLHNPSTGEQISRVNLGQPIQHQPLLHQDKIFISGMDGTIHIYDPQKQ